MPRCYAPGCNHGSDKCRLYRYPADPELYKKWTSLCRRENRLPTREDRLCSCHFIDGRKENLPTVFANRHESQGKKAVVRKMTDTKNEEVKTKRRKETKFENFTAECRACLKTFDSDTGLINILEGWPPPWDTTATTIADDLAKISNVQISITDHHSKVICKACYCKLHKACLFTNMVYKNDLELKKRNYDNIGTDSSPEKVWPKPIQVDKNINGTVLANAIEVEIKQEVLSDEEFDTNMSNLTNMTDLSNLDIKIEPEEIVDHKPVQITVNGTISLNGFNTGNLTNGDADFDAVIQKEEVHSDPAIKEEPMSEDEDSESVPDLSLECLLCTKMFSRVSGLKAHVIAQHSYKTVKRKAEDINDDNKPNRHVCVICRRSFSTSTDLMVHETCHHKAVCYGCSDKFDTFNQLMEHRTRCKAILIKTNTAQKLITLDDVKRPHHPPELKEEPPQLKDETSELKDVPPQLIDETSELADKTSELEDVIPESEDEAKLEDDISKIGDESSEMEDEKSKLEEERCKLEITTSDLQRTSNIKDDGTPDDEISELQDGKSKLEYETFKLEDGKSELQNETSKSEDEPSKMEDEPSKMEDEPSKMEDEPSKMEDEPSKMEDEPSKMEDDPSKMEDETSTLEDESSNLNDVPTQLKQDSAQLKEEQAMTGISCSLENSERSNENSMKILLEIHSMGSETNSDDNNRTIDGLEFVDKNNELE